LNTDWPVFGADSFSYVCGGKWHYRGWTASCSSRWYCHGCCC